jgi:serine/threonine-protein kinase
MSSNWVGKTLGKVKIESKLARGGMAEVYLGTHINLERKVAVKILRNPSEEHSDDLERFQREARVVASLRHPNIVQVYDFDMVDNDPYLIMEYVDGPSLSAYLGRLHKDEKKLKLPHVMRMLESIASALQYAHNNKIIHRDIKPGNILLTSPTQKIKLGEPLPDDFVPVLTDFGLIRFLDAARQTTTGMTAGTPAYMSPEQAQGEATDGQTDVYSLGVVLYEMLAGKLPFDGETTMSGDCSRLRASA